MTLSPWLVDGGANLIASEREVLKIEFAHTLRGADIASVDDQTAGHQLSRSFPIEVAEFVPFCADQDRFGVAQSFINVMVIRDLRQDGLGSRDSFWIGCVNVGACADKPLRDVKRGREAGIVRVGFERQTQHRNSLALDHPQSLMNFFEEAIDALFVDALGRFENVEVNPDCAGEVDEGLQIFRKAESAKSQPSLQELSADAWIETHRVSDFVDVGAKLFAEVGENVGVADFQSEERIGCVLDEFGAVDRGDEQRRVSRAGAAVFVNRTCKFSLENRPIDFAHLGGGGFVLDSDYDAIRVKEIFDRRAFAQEFRIGNDVESKVAAARIRVQARGAVRGRCALERYSFR